MTKHPPETFFTIPVATTNFRLRSEEEDNLITKRFSEGIKITQLAKLHSRTYGAIKARLLKLELIQK